MPQNFIACDREQDLLLPPSLKEWLPEDHLAWFVLATIDEMDLSAFYASYRGDGHGRAAHEPGMMLALLLYAYCKGQRSSRVIERECVEDVAYRVIAANQRPDHTTIARFRQRHEMALTDLFGQVLGLCAEAGLVQVGVVAIDGTKVHASASQHAARDYEQIAREILEEAAEADRLEDEQYGEKRGDELPPSSPPSRADGVGCVRLSVVWMRSVRPRPSRSRVRALSAFGSQSAGWRSSSLSSAPRTRPMRPTARAG
jgi:transposase